GPDATLALLADAPACERMRAAIEVTGSDGAHGETVDWTAIQIAGVQDASLAEAVGLTVAQWAATTGQDATTAALDLMRADRLGTGILMHVGDEENVQAIMRHPMHCAGSDGILVGGRPHPRAWGTFARYLGHYTRDLGVLTLEECVRHLAGTPARRLGLTDRGVVREGAVADLVLFDAEAVADRATFDEPRLPAAGIVHVVVGGEFAVRDGVRTDVAAGRLLRS
ncbi:MAG: amidohydrolase family protein, partial [Pseudolysinimonas sp.]